MLFEPGDTWTAKPDFAEPRLVSVEPVAFDLEDRSTLQVRGLLPADFALFAYFIDTEGVGCESYFATHYSKKRIAKLVNTDLVDADPDRYVTTHLHDLLRTIGEDELVNFGVEKLAHYVFRNRSSRKD